MTNPTAAQVENLKHFVGLSETRAGFRTDQELRVHHFGIMPCRGYRGQPCPIDAAGEKGKRHGEHAVSRSQHNRVGTPVLCLHRAPLWRLALPGTTTEMGLVIENVNALDRSPR